LISSSGTRYEGVITEGTIEKGRGIFDVKSGKSKGNRYKGEFLGTEYHGWGIFTNIGSLTVPYFSYEGEWKENIFHGRGTFTTREFVYVGEWKDGEYHGWGTFTTREFEYVGGWNDGKYHGPGTLTYRNGRRDVGMWKNGVRFDQAPKNPAPRPVSTSVKSSGASISGFIAVIDFEGNDISPSEARALTDRLRGELVGSGRFTIIERGKMEEILKEQAFQQTGCVSSECAVEVGKLLSVENIIIGSISRVGSINSVTAKVVSVESGEIIRSTVYDHSGDIGGLLTQGMRKVAEELGK
jgi:TolB-like protein